MGTRNNSQAGMRGLLNLIIYFLLFSMWACHSAGPPVKELGMAESMMEEHPDTALYVLHRIAEPANMSGKDYAMYCLLRTEAEERTGNRHTSDSLISVAVAYFKDQKDDEPKARSYFYMARVKEDMNDDATAEEYYLLAVATIEKTTGYKTSGAMYDRLGTFYKRLGRFDEAYDAQRKSYNNYLLANNKQDALPVLWLVSGVLLLVAISVFCYYRKEMRRAAKQASAREHKLASARQTITDRKAELAILKKDLLTVQRAFYDSCEVVGKIRRFNAVKPSAKERPALSEQEWSAFLNILEETCGFVSRLKQAYPRLSDTDIRVCSLLREGVITAHISSVLNMMPDTLARRMQRLKSDKMNVGGTAASLETIIRDM